MREATGTGEAREPSEPSAASASAPARVEPVLVPRPSRVRDFVPDALLALAVAALALVAHVGSEAAPGLDHARAWLLWPDLALIAAAILVRRRAPGLALALAWGSAAMQMIGLLPPGSENLGTVLVVFSCAALGSRAVRRAALASAIGGAFVAATYTLLVYGASDAQVATQADPQTHALVLWSFIFGLTAALLLLAWALGYARHLVLRGREQVVARRIAEVETAHLQAASASERERGRIAREMHDVLAHSLVVIATLSDGARLSIASDPEEAERAMRTIGEVSRDGLADVRRLLAELRHEQEAGPAASFDERDELVERFRGLGLDIRREVVGDELPLTPGASLAAYRVVQEGLTNALRHGRGGRPVRLVERWTPEGLELEVRSACRPERSGSASARELPSGGHGLAGLRERVLLEQGRFSAGRAGEEFLLAATLPVGRAERAGETERDDEPEPADEAERADLTERADEAEMIETRQLEDR